MLLEILRTAYQWYLIHKTPFELMGLLLAVSGTAFGMLSIRDGRKLTKDLRSIFDHLTTKEIGAYPTYMVEVERLISEARESIFIATDFPGHGVWGDRSTPVREATHWPRAFPKRAGGSTSRRAPSRTAAVSTKSWRTARCPASGSSSCRRWSPASSARWTPTCASPTAGSTAA